MSGTVLSAGSGVVNEMSYVLSEFMLRLNLNSITI